MEYSKRLGEISDAQIQAALSHFDLGELRQAEPVPFGLFGQNIFINSTAGQFVLRGGPNTLSQLPRERYYIEQLHLHTTVPVPWPYLVDESPEIFGWIYAIMPRMPGINLEDPKVIAKLSSSDRIAIARAMAQNLASMQTLTHFESGRWDAETNSIRPFDLEHEIAWWLLRAPIEEDESRRIGNAERVEGLIRIFAGRSPSHHRADLEWVESVLGAAHDAMRVSFQPCFVMEDYKPGNLVFSDGANGWRVNGVFDLAGAYFGDGEIDLSRTVSILIDQSPTLVHEFLQTYFRLRPRRDGFAERFRAYMLLDRLIIWDYISRHEPKVAAKLGTFRNWSEKYVDALSGLQ